MFRFLNIWFFSSFLVSIFVIIPIVTVFTSFFDDTSGYYELLKKTFLIEYILNSAILLFCVLILTFLLGTGSAYIVSFYEFPFCNFFKWALILSFAVPPYIYVIHWLLFENYGAAYSILKIFLEMQITMYIPKFDGCLCNIINIFLVVRLRVYNGESFVFNNHKI